MSLHITTLGDFHLLRDGVELSPTDWKNQKNRQLCQLLLTYRRNPPRREQLLEWLWPDLPPVKADRSLRVAISQLRRALEPELLPRTDSAYILTTPGGYAWNLQADYRLDTDRFEHLCAILTSSAPIVGTDDLLALGEEARTIYRGDYLPEDLYAEWAIPERERLRELYFAILTRLADAYAQAGRYQWATALCREVLAGDRCRESVWRQLMLYYYHAGDQARALHVYDECVSALAAELGIAPLPETQRIRQQIAERTVANAENGQVYPAPAILERARHAPISWARLPFVGRDPELARLVDTGPGCVLLVEGEAGAGKSRLAEEAAQIWRQRGCRVIRGQAQMSGALPLQPILDPLRAALTDAPAAVESLPDDYQATLAALFPLLRPAPEQATPPATLAQQSARAQLFDALIALLLALGQKRPYTLFCLDDLHWADPASLDFLTHLLPRLAAEPLLLLLTLRSEEEQSPALVGFLSACQERHLLKQITLRGLSYPACVDLCQRLSGAQQIAAPLGRWLHRESEGNPLFLLSHLQSLFEDGLLRVDEWGQWETLSPDFFRTPPSRTPSTVVQVIRRRLDRLEPAERQALEAAAVLGPRLERRLLAEMRGWHPHRLFDQLDRLVQAALLHEEAGDSYRFSHDKIRQIVYDAIPEERRSWLHSRAGQAIERVAQGHVSPWIAALAYHFDQTGEKESALHWRMAAGEQAAQVYDNTGALAHFQRALALLEEGDFDPPPGTRLLIHEHLGDLLMSAGHFSEALTHFVQAQNHSQKAGDRVRLLYRVASCHDRLGQWQPSRRLMAEAVGEVEQLGAAVVDPLEAARVLARWSILGATEYATAAAYARQAQALAAPWLQAPGDENQRLAWAEYDILHGVLLNSGEAFRHWGKWEEAEKLFERSLLLAEAQNDLTGIGYSSNNLGDVRLALGDFAAAQSLHRRAAATWAQTGEHWLEMAARTHWGLDWACAGDWSTALGHLEAARRVGESIEPTEWLATVHLCLALATAQTGTAAGVGPGHLARAETIASHIDRPLHPFLHPLALAALARQQGDDSSSPLAAAQHALARSNDLYGRWLLPQFLGH